MSDIEHIRDDAGELVIEQLWKFRNKIPKMGLNNYSRPKMLGPYTIPGKPTLPKRMDGLLVWHVLYLPPQMVAMGATSEKFDKDNARRLLAEVLELLTRLHDNLDTVTVVKKRQIDLWKQKIWDKKKYLMVTGRILGMVQEVEYDNNRTEG